MRGSSLVAVGLTILLVLSVLAAGSLATDRSSTTEITQCTTISEPGSYELAADLSYSGQDDCISIAANDVTFDGNSHTITYDSPASDSPFYGDAVSVTGQDNVTIRGVETSQHAGIGVSNSTAVTVANNELRWSLAAGNSRGLTVRNNHFTIGDVEIKGSTDVHVAGNHIDDVAVHIHEGSADVTARDNHGEGRLVVAVEQGEANVVNNTIHEPAPHHLNTGNAISVSGSEGTTLEVAWNDVTNGENGITVTTDGAARVHNNTVQNVSNYGILLRGTSDETRVTHNTVTDSDVGVAIAGGYETGLPATLEHNRLTHNRIGVKSYSNLPEIHQNDLSANTEYGVLYTQDNGVVNATHNYWGDRPSSTEDEHTPFEDPETEALANGTGSAVSEGSAPAGVEPGVSNVRFDPWLDTPPDAGVVDQSSDGDDSSDETTTTTTSEDTTTTTSEDSTTTTDETATTTTTDSATTTSTETTTTTGEDATTTAADESGTTESSDDAATTRERENTETTTASNDDTTTTKSEGTETTDASNENTTTPQSETTDDSETTTSTVPGFGHLVTLLALLATALFGARRA